MCPGFGPQSTGGSSGNDFRLWGRHCHRLIACARHLAIDEASQFLHAILLFTFNLLVKVIGGDKRKIYNGERHVPED